MKKLLLLAVVAILGITSVTARPVDVNTAKSLGQRFVQANFDRVSSADLQLVYTFSNQRGESSLYVFDVDDHGFVIVSADDQFRPIVGYSKEDIFHAENISPECRFYLNAIVSGREEAKGRSVDPEVVAEWQSLSENGRLMSFNGGRGVDFLVQTRWDQSPAPYNSMCPADPNGPGGHDYVGCVATATSQLFNYWKYPEHGQGSNSYVCTANPYAQYPGHPEYGTISANFGATTYDWDNMLNSYSGSYTPEQGEAVATLCFHCGVAVNMMYGNTNDNGSGAYSDDVPAAIHNYFMYTSAASLQSYPGNANLIQWKNTLKDQFDLGWPVYYSGTDPNPDGGGHAFICDGYDDADLFHFNFGWGGYQDAYYVVNEIDYYTNMRIIINFVPTDVYANAIKAPTNVTVIKTSDVAQEANISWTNPSQTLNNQTISTIERIVVERNNQVIYTEDNVTPGTSMSIVDSDVPCFSTFEYRVYAMNDGVKGKPGKATESFGPTCEWKVVGTASDMQGWKGGRVVAYDGVGHEVASVTMTNSNPASLPMNITLGKVSFAWVGTEEVTLSFKIKDVSGTVVYEYPQGSSNDIPAGYFFTGNNSCGNAAPTEVPGELYATQDGDNVVLTWGGAKTDFGYNIYRDGVLFRLAHSNEFVDVAPAHGGHCYYVCVLGEGGESAPSNEACATAGEGCEEGSNLWFEMQANNKPIITWDAPVNSDGLLGYEVYRKTNEDGTYDRIKLLGPDKTEYKETKSLSDGNWYYYRVIASYENDCFSAPFKSMYDNEYFVKIYYSVTDVNDALAGKVSVYPNPTNDNITVEAEGLQQVMVYNTIGQLVYSQACEGNAAAINLGNVEAGFYLVKVVCAEGETVRKISVIR